MATNKDFKVKNGIIASGTITSANIDVTGASGGNGQITVARTGGSTVAIQSQSARGLIGTSTNHPFRLMSNGTQRIELDTSGNFNLLSGALEINGTTVIDTSRNLTNIGTIYSGEIISTSNITATGFLQAVSYLYTRNNLRVLNAAGDGWNTWATRSNGNYNLDVGTISSGAITTSGNITSTGVIKSSGSDSATSGQLLNLHGSSVNQTNSGTIRLTEGSYDTSPFFQGGFIKYDGSSNVLKIGTHNASDSDLVNDIDAITIARSTGNANFSGTISSGAITATGAINSTGTGRAIQVNGTTRINSVGDIIGTSYYIGGTNIIDTSRNLTNIGTISSGDITTTGIQMGTGTSNDIQADGKTAYIGSAIFGNSASTNVPATAVHIKGSGTPTLRIEDTDSTNQVYDFITNFGVGLSIVDQTSSITPLAFAHTTGNATFAGTINSGAITSSGNIALTSNGNHVATRNLLARDTNGLTIGTTNATAAINIDNSANVSMPQNLTITGNLTVNGTTTTLNTQTLDVEDKNITLNYSTGDSSASADGAGLTIQDAVSVGNDATILWDSTNDQFDFSHTITLPDSQSMKFGDSGDLSIEHNSFGDSAIVNNTGDLYITNKADDGDIIFRSDDGSGGFTSYFYLDGGNGVINFEKNLYLLDYVQIRVGTGSDLQILHDASNSFLINNTGDLYIRNNTDDGDIKFQSDDGSGGLADYFSLDGAYARNRFHRNVLFGDGIRADFGNSSDLRIYHNANHNYIQDAGTGNLYIGGSDLIWLGSGDLQEVYATFNDDGSVNLYHNNSLRFQTTSTGINVTGTVTADGVNTDYSNGFKIFDGSSLEASWTHNNVTGTSTFNVGRNSTWGGELLIQTDTKTRANFASNGDISFYDDTGASENLKWDASEDTLNFVDNAKATFGTGGDLRIYHDGNNVISASSGNMVIDQNTNDGFITFRSDDGSGGIASYFQIDGTNEIVKSFKDFTVTGTVTSDGLTVDGNATINGTTPLLYLTESDTTDLNSRIRNSAGNFQIHTANDAQNSFTARVNISHSTGDISFYDDTGSTQGLFWDASAENLFVGGTTTTNAQSWGRQISSINSGTNGAALTLKDSNGEYQLASYTNNFYLSQGANTRFFINSSGSVGIGTTNPNVDAAVEIATSAPNTGITTLRLTNSVNNKGQRIDFEDDNANRAFTISHDNGGNIAFMGTLISEPLAFYTGGSEVGRFDSSGNLLVGTTDTSLYNNTTGEGVLIAPDHIQIARDSDTTAVFNRQGTDGQIITFNKAGATVGSIGVNTDRPYFARTEGGFSLSAAGHFIPATSNGSVSDNARDIGLSNARWRNLYLSGTISSGAITSSGVQQFTKSVYGAEDSENYYRIKLQDQGGIHNDVGIGQTTSGNMGFNVTAGQSFIFNGGTSGNVVHINTSGVDAKSGGFRINGTTVIDSSRNLTNIGTISSGAITSSDISNFQRDIRSAGQIRATGWYNDTASTDYTGMALEIGVSGSQPHILAYNRATASYGAMVMSSSGLTINPRSNDVTIEGVVNLTSSGHLEINSTTVIDSSRNLTNIATVNATQFKWNTDVSGTNYLGSDIYDGLVLHSRPNESIFYGSGETSSSVKAHIFYSSTTSNSALGNEVFSITAGGDSVFAGSISSGAITATGAITSTTGVSRFNGGIAVGSDNDVYFYESATGQASIRTGSTGAYKFFAFQTDGYLKSPNGYIVGSTVIVDGSRNLTNIGTISSGNITSSGDINTTTGTIQINGNDVITEARSLTNIATLSVNALSSPSVFSVNSSGNTEVGGTFQVLGNTTLDGSLSVGSDLTVTGGFTDLNKSRSSTTDPILELHNTNSTNYNGQYFQIRDHNGTVRGTIGTKSETNINMYISGGGAGLKFSSYITYKVIRPVNDAGTDADDQIDLGTSSARFDDIYATNGTIQTSDRNEKQDIQELSDAEQRVATACKGLIRRYKFNSAVEEKGDDARYHFGIIAQDLQDAFTTEGLDAGDYGMFISSTWTDEEGNEQTRLGVRYNELLAFIIATL